MVSARTVKLESIKFYTDKNGGVNHYSLLKLAIYAI